MTSTIDSAGRVVIPKAIRDAAGLKPGSPLQIEFRDGRVEIERTSPKVRLVRKGTLLVANIPGVPKMSVDETNEWIRKSRDREI
ncbi:MAG: AbrB/MazE/SpoVT family DNA-binding domain-containing protein [Bryobacteraceae bacterium]